MNVRFSVGAIGITILALISQDVRAHRVGEIVVIDKGQPWHEQVPISAGQAIWYAQDGAYIFEVTAPNEYSMRQCLGGIYQPQRNLNVARMVQQRGYHVRLDGLAASSCVPLLEALEAVAPKQVCATRKARFQFHGFRFVASQHLGGELESLYGDGRPSQTHKGLVTDADFDFTLSIHRGATRTFLRKHRRRLRYDRPLPDQPHLSGPI